MLEVIMMLPPLCSSIAGITDFNPSQGPFTLIDISRSNSSSEDSRILETRPSTPAFATKMSSAPNLSIASLANCSLCCFCVTSPGIQEQVSCSNSSPTFLRPSKSLSERTTLAPSLTNLCATAFPMPPAAPVITATFPDNLIH